MADIPTAGPWATRSEYLVDQALQNALSATPDQLRQMRPAAAPQQLFPKRNGFQKQEANIQSVLNVDRYTPTYRSWISGIPTQPSVISDYTWEGSSRNSMSGGTW
jgi:hypothetical protein